MTFTNTGRGNIITCPNCRQPYPAQVEQIIDVGRDPAAKTRFLAGQTGTATCPHCGYRIGLLAPLLYHDPAKELFLVYVPMELGLQHQEQERVIGQLVKAVMDSTPPEKRRGYMFQPRPMLSMQGLIEAILAADGVTPEMLEAQRARLRLVETFLQTDEDQIPGLVQQYDSQIDEEFVEILAVAAENARMSGRQDMANHAMHVRDQVAALSTAGKRLLERAEAQDAAIEAVVRDLQALGERPTIDAFIDLVIRYAGDDDRLQALVGLQYPLFDYNFFQALTGRIDAAREPEKAQLEDLRARLTELTGRIRQQQEARAEVASEVLGEIVNSENVEEALRRNLPYIDEMFLMLLEASRQAAEQNGDQALAEKLKRVAEAIDALAEESMPEELRFIRELLRQDSLEAARAMIDAQAAQYGGALLPIMDSLLEQLKDQGQDALTEYVQALRAYTAEMVG